MVQKVTQGIKISIETEFNSSFYKNNKMHYAYNYTVTIENQSNDTVQLISRYWKISDSLNNIEVVEGEGVIGQKPVLKPGTFYTYSSGCILISPFGSMKGFYNMINFSTTRKFKVDIPSFKLSAPFAIN
jgi:ApaG protein